MSTNLQIDKLANFIMAEVPGEPSLSEGAVDTAIRIIKSLQEEIVQLNEDKDHWNDEVYWLEKCKTDPL